MSTYQPPKLPLKLFKFYCSEERLEELEGDLFEVYNEFIEEKGIRFAKLFYWWLVIRGFRSYALKRTKMKNSRIATSIVFLRHNLVVSWRNLLKNRTTSAINILGLSIGIASFIAILSIVVFELSYNRQIPDGDRVYRIHSSFSGSFTATNRGVPIPVGPYVRETFSGLEAIAPIHTYSAKVEVPDESGQKKDLESQSQLLVADSSYFQVIGGYEWLAGSPDISMNEPFKVVLTDEQAYKYFGTRDWLDHIDREVIYRDSLSLFVSGIVKELDYNTDFAFTDFITASTIDKSWLKDRFGDDQWDNTNSSSQLWVKLGKNVNKANILMQMEDLDAHLAEQTEDSDWIHTHKLQSLADVHFDPEVGIFDNGKNAAHLDTLTVLGVVAFAILLIAVFNFVNLETAQSTTKSKEVGVRKVLGSRRFDLAGRFLTESILISFFAVMLAIPLAHYGFIYFEDFIPEGVGFDYSSVSFWVIMLLLTVGVGLLAGAYPSWVISSFRPVKALSALGTSRSGGSIIRKVLILIQFLFSQLLIVGSLAIAWQINFMLDKELGFKEDGIIYFYTPYYEKIEKQKLVVDIVDQMPEIDGYSIQNTPPVQWGYSTTTAKYARDTGEVVTSVHNKSGDTTWMKFYDIELLAGRNLIPNDTLKELIINETLMRDMGFDDPREVVNKSFYFSNGDHIVAGVMKDFHFRSLHHPIEPMAYRYSERSRCIALKVSHGDKIQPIIDKLTDEWEGIYPDYPLTVYFMDETIESFYSTERQASKMASTATGLAIFISCMGLFGLISFTIIQKSKELGIRKVLGASLFQIGKILSREFVLLIVISFAVSTPISYYIISKWMEDFAYKTDISWWIYVLGGVLSIIIALVSISVKVWKASGANPIESLKYE